MSEDIQIRNMPIGQTVYVVPWAFRIQKNGIWYVRGDYGYHNEPGGTAQVKISRKAKGIFRVDGETLNARYVKTGKLLDQWYPSPFSFD